MTTAILATAFTVGLITGGGLLLFFRRARAGGGSLPVKAAVVEQPDIFESSFLAAYAPEAPTSSLEIHVLSEGPREQLWLDHTSHEISEGPLAGYRVAYFVDITPAKSSRWRAPCSSPRRVFGRSSSPCGKD